MLDIIDLLWMKPRTNGVKSEYGFRNFDSENDYHIFSDNVNKQIEFNINLAVNPYTAVCGSLRFNVDLSVVKMP